MKRASVAEAARRLEDLRKRASALNILGSASRWFEAQEVSLASQGSLALGLIVDDRWLARLASAEFLWCEGTELLSWSCDTAAALAIIKVIERAETVCEEWPDARDMVMDAAEHQILVIAYG